MSNLTLLELNPNPNPNPNPSPNPNPNPNPNQVVGDRQLSSALTGVVGGMTLGNPVPLFVPPTYP